MSDQQSQAHQFARRAAGGVRSFQTVPGQMGGESDDVRAVSAGEIPPGMTREEHQEEMRSAVRRGRDRAEGRRQSAEGEVSEEAVDKEVERILNLHAATSNRVTQEAAARLRDAYQNPTGSPSA